MQLGSITYSNKVWFSFKILSLHCDEWYYLFVYSVISSLPNNIFSSIALFKYSNKPQVTFLSPPCVSCLVYVTRYIRFFLYRNHRYLSRRRIERMQTTKKKTWIQYTRHSTFISTRSCTKSIRDSLAGTTLSSCFTKYLSTVKICSRVIFQRRFTAQRIHKLKYFSNRKIF